MNQRRIRELYDSRRCKQVSIRIGQDLANTHILDQVDTIIAWCDHVTPSDCYVAYVSTCDLPHAVRTIIVSEDFDDVPASRVIPKFDVVEHIKRMHAVEDFRFGC